MMLLTTVAVLSRQLFNAPLLGLVELSEFALVTCIFVAMPGVFLRDENIVVDVVDHLVPRAGHAHSADVRPDADPGVSWALPPITMIKPAWLKFNREQTTLVLEIDLFYFWIPILFGFYLASAATLWLIVHRLINGSPPVRRRPVPHELAARARTGNVMSTQMIGMLAMVGLFGLIMLRVPVAIALGRHGLPRLCRGRRLAPRHHRAVVDTVRPDATNIRSRWCRCSS